MQFQDTLSFHGADELKFQSFPVGAASEIKGFDPSSNGKEKLLLTKVYYLYEQNTKHIRGVPI